MSKHGYCFFHKSKKCFLTCEREALNDCNGAFDEIVAVSLSHEIHPPRDKLNHVNEVNGEVIST